jgi:primary-amine oxidase
MTVSETVTATTPHPLDPLSEAELATAVAAVRATGRLGDDARFATATLAEPPKDAGDGAGDERCARLVIVPGPEAEVLEAVVSVTSGEVRSWHVESGMRPCLLFEEAFGAIAALHEHPGWREAMARRGIKDMDRVQIDPWPTGNFGLPVEEGRRIARCLAYYREEPTDNGYARPVEGVAAVVDIGRREVLEVVDRGVVPLPPERGGYLPADVGPVRTGLRPLEIVQPDGPSFTVDGHLIRWQGWSLRVRMDPIEGLVLHTVGFEDGGRVRPVLHRASVSEMVVPYGDPSDGHGWKNAFDVGEWGLGRMTNSLAPGCDCLGEIRYLDATFVSEQGEPTTVPNAICVHEEDRGILWKHVDLHAGTTEVRRSRRLVVSTIATVGNYDYAFYWYLYLDGTIELEVKLTGVLSTRALSPGETTRHSPLVAPQLAAPVHQHLFCVRIDLDVDGTVNEVYEVDAEPLPGGPDNPWGGAFAARETRLETESGSRRVVDPTVSRCWKVVNPGVRNGLGQPVGYKLVPGPAPTLLARPGSSVARRAGFATANLWVTPYADGERRAAGEYPNQHAGCDGLPRWTQADRPVAGTDVVLWHTFGVTHVPRPEDWPVMPEEHCGFLLVPVGFFDRNPALDVPAPDGHGDGAAP